MFLANRMRAAAGNRGGIPADGLVVHYTMDTISGSTLINEQSGFYATITGATQTTGMIGDGLLFDSTGEKVEIPGGFLDNVSEFLISVLYRSNVGNTDASLFSIPSAGQSSSDFDTWCEIRESDTAVRFGVRVTGGTREFFDVPFPAMKDGEWHSVILFYDGSNIYVSIDDVETQGPSISGTVSDGSRNTNIGQRRTDVGGSEQATNQLLATLDQLRIYASLPSRQERSAIATEGF